MELIKTGIKLILFGELYKNMYEGMKCTSGFAQSSDDVSGIGFYVMIIKQDHLELIGLDHVQKLLNVSKEGDFTVSLSHLCQCCHSHRKKVFRDDKSESVFQAVPITSGPVTGHH
ncbi:hypothetical protein WISP_118406 [Willisornis vidua]|uniref:Uncharacterized protein n=1 Tax=Willisornis vidua TaxID=1566151 RepID=A0ABQ9CZ76_9PASS|nr:hypothetical protein WISP_118406 [Willisornis vidua]